MTDSFINALEDLLEDQLDLINIEKISPGHQLKKNRQKEIFKTLQSLPETFETKAGTINIHHLIFELTDLTGHLESIQFDTGIKHGFSLAFKLIIHNLSQ